MPSEWNAEVNAFRPRPKDRESQDSSRYSDTPRVHRRPPCGGGGGDVGRGEKREAKRENRARRLTSLTNLCASPLFRARPGSIEAERGLSLVRIHARLSPSGISSPTTCAPPPRYSDERERVVVAAIVEKSDFTFRATRRRTGNREPTSSLRGIKRSAFDVSRNTTRSSLYMRSL